MTPVRSSPTRSDRSYLHRNVVIGLASLSVVVLGMSYHTSLPPATAAEDAAHSGDHGEHDGDAGPTGAPTSSGDHDGGTDEDTTGTATSTHTGPPTPSRTTSPAPTTSSRPGRKFKDGTYGGAPVDTRYGPIRVSVTVSKGRIVSAKAMEYPHEDEVSTKISNAAVPKLNASVVAHQSAEVDAVSGATYTSEGYTKSVQAAIDKARS